MPNAPRRYMPRSGGGVSYKPRERRGTAHQRGYDDAWANLRKSYLAQHPTCEDCPYPRAQYVEVDHVIPFSGQDDPLRLDERNLRTRCRRCHGLKTARLDGPTRAYFEQHRAAVGEAKALQDTWAKYRTALSKANR